MKILFHMLFGCEEEKKEKDKEKKRVLKRQI